MTTDAAELEVGNRLVRISNPGRVYFPARGETKLDLAREKLGRQAAVHWSVADPVPAGDPASFDAAVAELSYRVALLAPRLAATS